MALNGRLDQFSLGDVLVLLASSGASGKLSLTQAGGWGVVVFRQGRIIYAASNSARETLGNMLLCLDLVSERDLNQGLIRQASAEGECRLGGILVGMGVLSQADLERVVGDQIREIVAELLGWDGGFFRFQRMELPDRGEVEVETGGFISSGGLPADRLLLDLESELATEIESEDEGEVEATLDSIMTEFCSPAVTGELTLSILDYAQKLVRRGVLFAAVRRGFIGVNQFGIEASEDSAIGSIRDLTLPLQEPTVLRDAISRKAVHRTPLEKNNANRHLIRQLGGGWPTEVVVAPLIVGGRSLMIFYGDNLPSDDPIRHDDGFDLILVRAGLAMEERLLAKRSAYAERLRQESAEPR